jgi:DNA-directed RNA polymerase subunit L
MFHDYVESGPFLMTDKTAHIGARFRLSPSNSSVANTLRRQILVGIPTVAFRTEPYEQSGIQVETNTTPLVNEMLCHRIGMIPIAADPDTFNPDRYEFHISKENTTKQMIDIHASDFVVIERNPEDPTDEGRQIPTEQFFPPDPITGDTCLITRLRPQWNPIATHEKLVLKAKASISTGTENIRWSPVSQCSFENTRDEDPDRQAAMFEKWVSVSKKIPDLSAIATEQVEELRREYNTMEVQRCFRLSETGEPDDFTFYIESVGVLSPKRIVADGIKSIIRMLEKYQDLDGELPENVSISHGDTRFPSVDILFRNEGHTLGNLLQHYLVEQHIEGVEDPTITYAGYKVPHPLKAEMVIRIGLSDDMEDPEAELRTARLAIAKVTRNLKSFFQSMLEDWNRSVNPPA